MALLGLRFLSGFGTDYYVPGSFKDGYFSAELRFARGLGVLQGRLSILFRKVSEGLVQSEPGSEAHRAAIASLENIARTMTVRRSLRFKPPGF